MATVNYIYIRPPNRFHVSGFHKNNQKVLRSEITLCLTVSLSYLV